MNKTLLYGYGNRGRQDDGLGPLLAERVKKKFSNIDIEEGFQLNIEDAATISEYETVIFIDAAADLTEPTRWEQIQPSAKIHFSTHAMEPDSILALCTEIYEKTPCCYLLSIKGVSWEFEQELTPDASDHLEQGYKFLSAFLQKIR